MDRSLISELGAEAHETHETESSAQRAERVVKQLAEYFIKKASAMGDANSESSIDNNMLFSNQKNLKDVGAAFAIVSVFVATLSVSLLSYTHDIFSNRPSGSSTPASDSAITALFFVSVVSAVVAAMEFTALQLSDTVGSSSPNSQSPARAKKTIEKDTPELNSEDGNKDVAAALRHTANVLVNEDKRVVDPEAGSITSRNSNNGSRNFALSIVHDMAEMSVTLLFLSCATLFAGIFTFIWSNETRAVGITVTVVFGLLCIGPIGNMVLFFVSLL